MGAVTELPVLITRDRPGNQQTAATLDVSEQSLPCTLTQRLRRRKDHKLRRAELGDVVLGNHIGSDLQFVRERANRRRSEEHTSELQSRVDLVCRLLLEKKKKKQEIRVQHR